MQLSYQEYNYFMDRYKQVVFGYVTEALYEYVDVLKVKAGPYKDISHYKLIAETNTMELVHEKIGPSKYYNLNRLISKTVNNKFYAIVDRYAVDDCDYRYCCDCAGELVEILKKYWRLY